MSGAVNRAVSDALSVRLKRLVKSLLAGVLVLGMISAAQAAMLWHFSDGGRIPPSADLIAVFPGEAARITAGVALAAKGVSSNLLIAGGGPGGLAHRSTLPHSVRLIDAGGSRDTFEDALGTRRRIREYGFKRVLLVTSDYHMLRSWVLLKLLLAGSGVEVRRVAVSSTEAASLRGLTRLGVSEMVKLWANLGELGFYAITGRRPDLEPLAEWLRPFLNGGNGR